VVRGGQGGVPAPGAGRSALRTSPHVHDEPCCFGPVHVPKSCRKEGPHPDLRLRRSAQVPGALRSRSHCDLSARRIGVHSPTNLSVPPLKGGCKRHRRVGSNPLEGGGKRHRRISGGWRGEVFSRQLRDTGTYSRSSAHQGRAARSAMRSGRARCREDTSPRQPPRTTEAS